MDVTPHNTIIALRGLLHSGALTSYQFMMFYHHSHDNAHSFINYCVKTKKFHMGSSNWMLADLLIEMWQRVEEIAPIYKGVD